MKLDIDEHEFITSPTTSNRIRLEQAESDMENNLKTCCNRFWNSQNMIKSKSLSFNF